MSLWESYLDNKSFPSLKRNLEIDTLIIGGGLVGISALYFLEGKKEVCLVDANKVGSGVTKNTTGKITFLQEDIYNKLLKQSYKKAAAYLKSQIQAISLIKEIIKKEKIDCDIERSSSFLITNQEKEVTKIKDLKRFLEKEGIEVEEKNPSNISPRYSIKVKNTYVFNPIKFINSLKNKESLSNKIYENTKIVDVQLCKGYYFCKSSDNKTIKAKNVIIACHYPFFLKPLLLPFNSTIEKSYICVTKAQKNEKYNLITYSKPTLSFRFYQDKDNIYNIYLAKSHDTANNMDDEKNFEELLTTFAIERKNILYKWTNVDIMSNDNLPFIGKIKNNMYIGTGFSTWGMTNSILSGKIISDLVLENKNGFVNLFEPKRCDKWLQIYKSIASNTVAYSKALDYNKTWYNENISFETKDGKLIAIYKDEKGKIHKVLNKCPHLGCRLIFNSVDKTWDCPCHSSRFDIDGNCVKGPSTKDIKIK